MKADNNSANQFGIKKNKHAQIQLTMTKGILYRSLDGYCSELDINIPYGLQLSEKKITNIDRKKLTKFYQEIVCAFNE